jgi:hypothetical protein
MAFMNASLSTACGESKMSGSGALNAVRYSRARVPTLRNAEYSRNRARVRRRHAMAAAPDSGPENRLLSPRYKLATPC